MSAKVILSISLKELQERVGQWMRACFGEPITSDKIERNYRFLEEALELVQSLGLTKDEAHQLVDYVYGRPEGDTNQEMGGAIVTLAALSNAHGMRMDEAADAELERIWSKIETIRTKQATKPRYSPLPS